MNKLQSILDIVRDKNPETMELSFGCLIKVKDYSDEGEQVFISNGSYQTDGGFRLFDVRKQNQIITEIIGHPLYPAHLLVALERIKDEYGNVIDHLSYEHRTIKVSGGIDLNYYYKEITLNLTQPLEPQLQANPELVETLYSLLTK